MPDEERTHSVVRFDCPTCSARLRAALGLCGRRAPCPQCGEPVIVPPAPPDPFDTPSDAPTLPIVPALRR